LGHPYKFQRVSHLGSVIARHSSSGRELNFAALNRGRNLYSAGRPSRWALAHILILTIVCCSPPKTDKQVMVSGAVAKVSFLCHCLFSNITRLLSCNLSLYMHAKYTSICIALYHDSSLKRSGMARVNEGSHSFACHPHIYP